MSADRNGRRSEEFLQADPVIAAGFQHRVDLASGGVAEGGSAASQPLK
jgi:hypothetical protein